MAINANTENGTADKIKVTKNGNYKPNEPQIKLLLVETILGYIFWSLFHGLGPMIWFYPLNQLEISGYEPILLVLFTPIITCNKNVFRFIQSHYGLSCLQIISLAGLASFQLPSTFLRLIILAWGTGSALLVFTATLWSGCAFQRYITFWGLMLGFLASLVGRIWYVSLHPTWSDSYSNNVVLALGAIATFNKIFSGFDKSHTTRTTNSPVTVSHSWFLTGLAFGSLLFLTHWLFSEVSVICRWTNTGYPDPGPHPIPWGSLVLVSLFFGLWLSNHSRYICNKLWWFCGVAGFIFLYSFSTYKSFFGGCFLGVFTMSLWPVMIDRVTRCSPAHTMVTAMAVYIFEILFEIWTVAYNFVPGGIYTRERTGFLIFIIMFALGIFVFTGSSKDISFSNTAFSISSNHHVMAHNTIIKVFLGVLLIAGLTGIAFRYIKIIPQHPLKTESKEFTALIWTYHFGYDNQGWPSFERSAEMLANTGADVIGLLESDASKPFLGNNDLASWLSEHLNMHVDFGPSTRDHTWGNLLLSKYPIVSSKHHLLPSPHGELAPALSATINISGNLVDFVLTHMGNDRDVLDRKMQSVYLAKLLKNTLNPVVFLGYVTSAPGSREYRVLLKKGETKDIDDTDYERWCEYILYRGLIRHGYARLSHGELSDTEIQIAKFEIPTHSQNFKDNDVIVLDPTRVPSRYHFNSKYGGFNYGHNWNSFHGYHMGTPKYFIYADSISESH